MRGWSLLLLYLLLRTSCIFRRPLLGLANVLPEALFYVGFVLFDFMVALPAFLRLVLVAVNVFSFLVSRFYDWPRY
jgi:hypothetical protein